MTSRKKVRFFVVAAILLATIVCVIVGFKSNGYGIEVNDRGTGLQIYRHYEVRSQVKEGYLVLYKKQTLITPGLSRQDFYEYRLFDAPNSHAGFFEVWSDQSQPNQSYGKTTYKGPKLRLELESRKIDALKADVWYIKHPL